MTQQETEGLAPARRPKVLIVVPPPGAGCREAEAFIGALLSSRVRQGFELRLALRGASLPDGAELPNGVGSLPFEETSTDGSRFALRRALRRAGKIHREYPFAIVHTFTGEDQRVFGAWKRRSGEAVFLIRTWFTPEAIPDTRENRTLHTRTTDINMILGHETLRRMREDRPKGTLLLDHPCVVGEAPDLSGPGIDNLEHCYLALTAPTPPRRRGEVRLVPHQLILRHPLLPQPGIPGGGPGDASSIRAVLRRPHGPGPIRDRG